MAMMDRFPFEELPIYPPSDCTLETELIYLAAIASRLGLCKASIFLNQYTHEEPCRCHIDDELYHDCVLDTNRKNDCDHAKELRKKEDCPFWRK